MANCMEKLKKPKGSVTRVSVRARRRTGLSPSWRTAENAQEEKEEAGEANVEAGPESSGVGLKE